MSDLKHRKILTRLLLSLTPGYGIGAEENVWHSYFRSRGNELSSWKVKIYLFFPTIMRANKLKYSIFLQDCSLFGQKTLL